MQAALRAVLAVFSLLLAGHAGAATLQVDASGELVGALNVNVNGTFYNVQFVEGSCVSVFSGCGNASDLIPFPATDADEAAQALLDQVFVGVFDDEPARTFGCENLFFCGAQTPSALFTESGGLLLVQVLIAFNEAAGLPLQDFIQPLIIQRSVDSGGTLGAAAVWARWTPATTSVGEPSALALLGLAAFALVWSRRARSEVQERFASR